MHGQVTIAHPPTDAELTASVELTGGGAAIAADDVLADVVLADLVGSAGID